MKAKGKRRRWVKWTILIISALLVIIFIATYQIFFQIFTMNTGYTYESSDRGMAELEYALKGVYFKVVEDRFENYKRWKQDPSLQLYRTCKRKWTNPWLWYDNLTNPRWDLPYIEPSQKPKVDYRLEMRRSSAESGGNK